MWIGGSHSAGTSLCAAARCPGRIGSALPRWPLLQLFCHSYQIPPISLKVLYQKWNLICRYGLLATYEYETVIVSLDERGKEHRFIASDYQKKKILHINIRTAQIVIIN